MKPGASAPSKGDINYYGFGPIVRAWRDPECCQGEPNKATALVKIIITSQTNDRTRDTSTKASREQLATTKGTPGLLPLITPLT